MNNQFIIQLSENSFDVIITYKKIKNMYVRIDDNLNIVVSCNKYFTKKKIEQFIIENEEKIMKMYISKQKQVDKNKWFYYNKKPYQLCLDKTIENCIFDDKNKILYIKNPHALTKLINKVLKGYVDEIIPTIKEDIPKFTLRLRSMKSKWGVCNRANNTITLNYNLIGCTEEFIRYVILHEICHFTVFNHSKDFYSLVSKYMPDYKNVIKDNKEW